MEMNEKLHEISVQSDLMKRMDEENRVLKKAVMIQENRFFPFFSL
jgi:hypothetical protein